MVASKPVLTDLKAQSYLRLEDEILDALESPNPRLELAQIARWNGVNPDIIEDTAKAISQKIYGKDLERLEFESIMRQMEKLELEEPNAAFREWRIQGLARKVKRTPQQLLQAYNKSLAQKNPARPLSVREFRAKQAQEVSWLIQGWMPQGTTVLLHADGGVGKTLFAYQVIESILTGNKWNGYQVAQGGVLLVQVDEPELVTQERIDIRGISDDAPLSIFSDWQVEQMPDLENTIAETKPAFVVIDSLTAINRNCCFSENDTEYARPILQLAAIATKHNCTVLIVHHSNAEGNSRGTRAIFNSVSEVWGLSAAENGDRLLRVQKTRLGRPPGRYRFSFDEDDFSFTYQGEDGGSDAEVDATQEERIRLWLAEDAQRGRRFASIEVSELLSLSRHCARRACYELWAKGLVKRTRSGRHYLYYIESFGSPPSDQGVRPLITCDHLEVITSETIPRQVSGLSDQSDHQNDQKFIIENAKNDDHFDHFDHFVIKASDSGNSPSDHPSDHCSDFGDHFELIDNVITSPILQTGDIVIMNATAVWLRAGSDKLPWREIPPSQKDKSAIPVTVLSVDLFTELVSPSKVLEFSQSGTRVKVRNQETGRTSVFRLEDVRLLRRGGDPHANG